MTQKATTSATVPAGPGIGVGERVERRQVGDAGEAESEADDERHLGGSPTQHSQWQRFGWLAGAAPRLHLCCLLLLPAVAPRLVAPGAEQEIDRQGEQADDDVLERADRVLGAALDAGAVQRRG